MKPEELEAALSQVEKLAWPTEDMYYQKLQTSYRRVQRFLPGLLKTIRFGATTAGQPVVEALAYLAEKDGRSKITQQQLGIVTKGWTKYVVGANCAVDKKAYVFCCMDRLRTALRRRDQINRAELALR